MKKFYLTIIVIFSILPLSSTGQELPPHLKFRRISESHGLQVEMINDIEQGPLGFIWLATNDGLYRYDGLQFTVYRHQPEDTASLPNNYVLKLFFDSDDNFWVLTDHGLSQYNYATNKFDIVSGDQCQGPDQIHNTNGMVEVGEDAYYISTYQGGVMRFKDGCFYPLNADNEALLSNEGILTMALQDDSLLWVGSSDNGLINYNLETKETRYFLDDRIHANTVYAVYEDSQNNIWAGSNEGLYIITPGKEVIHIQKDGPGNLPDNKILSVFEDHLHNMWIGTGESGLVMAGLNHVLSRKEQTQFRIYEASDRLNTVSYRSVNCIFQDQSNNIWLGTYNDGLNVFNPEGEQVTNYMHYPNIKNSLPHNRVWGMCEDHDGMLWIGTDGNGICRFDPFAVEFKHYPYQNGKPTGPNDKAILTALCDRNNNLWFGTYQGGVSFFDRDKQQFKHYYKKPDGSSAFTRNDVRVLYESHDGTIWAGTNRGGLYRFNFSKQDFEGIEKCSSLDIRSITEDSEGNLWLGTFGNGGLSSYNPENDVYRQYDLQEDIPNTTTIILSACLTSDSVLWLGSQYYGLIRFQTQTGQKKIYNTADGLSHNTIKAIINENDTTLWLSTGKGIASFQINTETFNHYAVSDGFLPGLFNDNSSLRSKHGYLAFGGDNGLNLFYPGDLEKVDTTFPSLAFTDFKLFNQSMVPGSDVKNNPLGKSIWKEDTIVLSYNQNVFTLEYVALDYPFSGGWDYEFIMEGYDEDWNKVSDQNSSTYRNLPPGTYTFRVRVTGKSENLHGPEQTMAIIVNPPWWGTVWAYSFYIVLASLIAWIVFRYYIKQIKLKNSLYYEKKLRQQEHDLTQEKLKFYTNFSHEMRTPLSLILGPSNDLLNQKPRSDQKQKIDIIKRNASYLLELLNKLLEFRKAESNKIVLNVTHGDINALIQQEIEFFAFQAKQKNIALTYEITGATHGWADFSSIQIILSNLLSNALKFTPSEGFIRLTASNANEHLTITVENSGEGLSEKDQQAIFTRFFQGENAAGHGGTGIGLALCNNLVELHNGSIQAGGKQGVSAVFTFSIPVSKSNYEDMPHARFVDEYPVASKEMHQLKQEINMAETKSREAKKLILLVDDHFDLITYLQSILSPVYEIISASDGNSGIEMARNHIPDLVISDVMMPQKSGTDLCQVLKADIKTSHIPIILLTAKHTNEAKIEGFEKGADSYIVKPFDAAVLLSQINGLFRNRKLLRDFFKKTGTLNREDDATTLEEKFLMQLETCILNMYEDHVEISVPELCRAMGYSKSSLYRKIKAISDLSINQIIKSVKLRKAAQMLKEDSDLSISQTAFNLGFNDMKYFRESFKEQFGMTPSEYRKNLYQTDG